MKKSFLLIVLLTMGLIFFIPAFASDEAGERASESAGEEVIAMCEDKYSPEKYADENERNDLIDACIKEATKGASAPGEQS